MGVDTIKYSTFNTDAFRVSKVYNYLKPSFHDNSLYCLQITQLKIDNNPFAKGFREAGAGKSAKK